MRTPHYALVYFLVRKRARDGKYHANSYEAFRAAEPPSATTSGDLLLPRGALKLHFQFMKCQLYDVGEADCIGLRIMYHYSEQSMATTSTIWWTPLRAVSKSQKQGWLLFFNKNNCQLLTMNFMAKCCFYSNVTQINGPTSLATRAIPSPSRSWPWIPKNDGLLWKSWYFFLTLNHTRINWKNFFIQRNALRGFAVKRDTRFSRSTFQECRTVSMTYFKITD